MLTKEDMLIAAAVHIQCGSFEIFITKYRQKNQDIESLFCEYDTCKDCHEHLNDEGYSDHEIICLVEEID